MSYSNKNSKQEQSPYQENPFRLLSDSALEEVLTMFELNIRFFDPHLSALVVCAKIERSVSKDQKPNHNI